MTTIYSIFSVVICYEPNLLCSDYPGMLRAITGHYEHYDISAVFSSPGAHGVHHITGGGERSDYIRNK